MSGGVKIVKEDVNGNITILAKLESPDLFGEALACAETARSPVTVQASEKSEILHIDYKRLLDISRLSHSRLIENMMRIIAEKNVLLNLKIAVLSKRTTREKLLAFLNIQGGMTRKFTLPYNREEMAHYLCVDRSAMSSELCKMRDEGLIRFTKNAFEFL